MRMCFEFIITVSQNSRFYFENAWNQDRRDLKETDLVATSDKAFLRTMMCLHSQSAKLQLGHEEWMGKFVQDFSCETTEVCLDFNYLVFVCDPFGRICGESFQPWLRVFLTN